MKRYPQYVIDRAFKLRERRVSVPDIEWDLMMYTDGRYKPSESCLRKWFGGRTAGTHELKVGRDYSSVPKRRPLPCKCGSCACGQTQFG